MAENILSLSINLSLRSLNRHLIKHVKHITAPISGETYCATHNPAQRVPSPFIKPVEKLIEAICGEMVRGSVVEPEAKGEKNKGLYD